MTEFNWNASKTQLDIISYGQGILYFILANQVTKIVIDIAGLENAFILMISLTINWIFLIDPLKSILSLMWFEKPFVLTSDDYREAMAHSNHIYFQQSILKTIESVSSILMYVDFNIISYIAEDYFIINNYTIFQTFLCYVALLLALITYMLFLNSSC